MPISRQSPYSESQRMFLGNLQIRRFFTRRQLMRFFTITKMKSVCTLYTEVKFTGIPWNLTEGSVGKRFLYEEFL